MSIHVACPHCGKRLKAPDEHAGKKARCKQCQQPFRITPDTVASSASSKRSTAKKRTKSKTSVPDVNAPPSGTSADEWYLLGADEQQYGPVPRSILDQWFEEGRINTDCQIYCRGWKQWKWADDIYTSLAAGRGENGELKPASSAVVEVRKTDEPNEPAPVATIDALETSADKSAGTAAPPLSESNGSSTMRRALRRTQTWARLSGALISLAVVAALGGGGYLLFANRAAGLTAGLIVGAAMLAVAILGGLPLAWSLNSYAKKVDMVSRNPTQAQWQSLTEAEPKVWKALAFGILAALLISAASFLAMLWLV